jgi:hypothetical protein
MIVTVSSYVQRFFRRFCQGLSDARCDAVARLVAGILFARGKRTQSELARCVVSEGRAPNSVSRRMRRGSFGTRNLVRHMMERQIAEELAHPDAHLKPWFLAIDGVCTQRGGDALVENAIVYRKKRRGDRGRSTKAHAFVQGLLITPSGRRIPLPRRSYYTQKYVNRENRLRKEGRRRGKPLVFKTQVDLARLIVEELELPQNVQLVVTADQYFEGTKLTGICRKKGYVFIAPVDSRRTYEPKKSLHDRGKRLPRDERRKLILRRGREDTASSRRYSQRSARKEARRVYRYVSERRTIAQIGEVAVVYSWKERTDSSGNPTGKHSYKVLVCSDPTIDGALIIEWFEIRWQVELFFRELKSDLGLEDYRGSDFTACERHYDLTLLTFMLLEQYRVDAIAAERSVVRRRMLAQLRTSKLRAMLERDARREDAAWFARERRSDDGREKIVEFFPPLRPTGSAG